MQTIRIVKRADGLHYVMRKRFVLFWCRVFHRGFADPTIALRAWEKHGQSKHELDFVSVDRI